MQQVRVSFLLTLLTFIFSCNMSPEPGSAAFIQKATSGIDDDALVHAAEDSADWISYGRNYSEDRYSPLLQINKGNVNKLGLEWSLDLGFRRGFEATPIVVDGIMYVTGAWSKVYAIDVRTGKLIWTYDPKVSPKVGMKSCCDVVNRGVAMYKGKIFFGALDGRLISLDAADGSVVWEVYTVDTTKKYTITGAPRVVKGKVIIGNSGAEFGVRGYITAYDAESGKQAWRFYTVPGDPSKGFESKAMEMAAKTWSGEWWKYGGGGTCWDAMAYDPDLNLFYVGTGNGSPWNRRVRSPGGGDNLFLSSIVAINPDNGEYVWHYQTTPGEDWDYTATQPLVLADLEIEGALRKVIMQAPKNGFFYVVDRTNGKFISAKPFTYVNWASGISLEGRPVENEFPMLASMNVQTFPGPDGAHSWHPMAFNLKNKLMYIPIHDISFPYGYDSTWKYGQLKEYGSGNGYNTGRDIDPDKAMSPDPNAPEDMVGYLIAWDPVQQKQVWKFRQKHLWNGGVVTTAAGLVFQGAGDGVFRVFDGDNGKVLWETNIGTGAIAPPVTYMVDGIQYVSIPVGWGGSVVALWEKGTSEIYPARIFTFKLNGKAKMPEFYATEKPKPLEVNYPGTAAELKQGSKIYLQYCFPCHGPVDKNYGALPDLGHMQKVKFDLLDSIVLKGLLQPLGMPNFGDRLTPAQVDLLKKYIASSAKQISKD